MRSDVSPAKKFAGWDTILILEEMEAESILSSACNGHNGGVEEPAEKKAKIDVNIIISSVTIASFYG